MVDKFYLHVCLCACARVVSNVHSGGIQESCFRKREINRLPSHVTGSKGKIQFCARQVRWGFKRADVIESITILSSQAPETNYFMLAPYYFCFGTSFQRLSFGSYFSRISPVCALC